MVDGDLLDRKAISQLECRCQRRALLGASARLCKAEVGQLETNEGRSHQTRVAEFPGDCLRLGLSK